VPPVALAIILADAAAVELFLVRRPALLLSLLPTLALALQALVPGLGTAAAAAALVAGMWIPSLLLAAVPAGAAGALRWSGPRPRWAAGLALALLALFAYRMHTAAAENRDALVHGLDAAIAARDRGDVQSARQILSRVAAEFPGSHVPLVLLGEIEYRTERLEAARSAFSRAAAIKGDDPATHRYLAVIERRLGRRDRSASAAARGLAAAPDDLELRYLAGEQVEPRDPRSTQALASLAFEVGDAVSAAALLDRGLARWPGERSFYPARVKLALRAGQGDAARRVLADWRARFPEDAEARRLAEQLSVN
jgi:predicted Zn-dependent protease